MPPRTHDPRHLIFIVPDSLRYDAVYPQEHTPTGLPYTTAHAHAFTQARAPGCWTLPATASLFTSKMPHEHGADALSRGLDRSLPTLAEQLAAAGWRTVHITANPVTTEVFGLDRGFQEVHRVWKDMPTLYPKIENFLLLIGKPRIRRMVFSSDFIGSKISEELESSKVWLQDALAPLLARARAVLAQADRDGVRCFLFLNLMECHFPYHVEELFSLTTTGWRERLGELHALFHFVNQTLISRGSLPFDPRWFSVLRQRQRRAWERVAPQIDTFIAEQHQRDGVGVVLMSDHGDAFGEQGWAYHFSNVSDGGNRVPFFYLPPGSSEAATHTTPLTTRGLASTLLRDAGLPAPGPHLLDEPEAWPAVMQSCWYNAQGRTVPDFRANQLCFVEGGQRWMCKRGAWSSAPPQVAGVEEPTFQPLDPGVNPIEELSMPPERRAHYRSALDGFAAWSTRLGGWA